MSKSFVFQLTSFDISNKNVWGSNLPSTIVTFELSKHKYLTFIIKFNNKIGNKNKIKGSLSYIVKIDYSILSLRQKLFFFWEKVYDINLKTMIID